MKAYRQSLVVELVDREPITSQEQLRERLLARGIEVTQATLSRDIRDLGLVKRSADGAYRRPAPDERPRPGGSHRGAPADRRGVAEAVRRRPAARRAADRVGAGASAGRGDRSRRAAEVVGTIGGENTILVICRGEREAQSFTRQLEQWVKG